MAFPSDRLTVRRNRNTSLDNREFWNERYRTAVDREWARLSGHRAAQQSQPTTEGPPEEQDRLSRRCGMRRYVLAPDRPAFNPDPSLPRHIAGGRGLLRLSPQPTPGLRGAQGLSSDALKEVLRKDALPNSQGCLHQGEIVILIPAFDAPPRAWHVARHD